MDLRKLSASVALLLKTIWNKADQSSPMIFGIMDSLSPSSLDHTALNPYVLGGNDFVNEGQTRGEHGTSVLGVATGVAENPISSSDAQFYVAKVARERKLKISNGNEIGYPVTEQDIQNYIDAILWLEAKKTRIVIMSPQYRQIFALNNKLQETMCKKSSMFFILPAGNDHLNISREDSRRFPASFNCPNILVVGALDSNGGLASFSNYGETVRIAAPGVNLNATLPGNNYTLVSGTSVSAPFVLNRFVEPLKKNGSLTNQDLLNMAPDLQGIFALDASGNPIPPKPGNSTPKDSPSSQDQNLPTGDKALIITWAIVGPLLISCGIAAIYYRKPLQKLLRKGRSGTQIQDPEIAIESHDLSDMHRREQPLIQKYGVNGYENKGTNDEKPYQGKLVNSEGEVAFLEIEASQTREHKTPIGEVPFELVHAQAEGGKANADQMYKVSWQNGQPMVSRYNESRRSSLSTQAGPSTESNAQAKPSGSQVKPKSPRRSN